MVIKTNQVFTWLPKPRNTHVSLTINGTEEKTRTLESQFRRPVTIGIGDFRLALANAGGQKSGLYSSGQAVKFYADNSGGATLKFWGIIDYVKEVMGKDGQLLEIEGRHRAYLASETQVCYSATGVECGTLLKALVAQFLAGYGFTTDNVSVSTGKTMTVTWNYKPFWECVVEICNYSGHDCYIDNDLGIHFFKANSAVCEDDAVVEGHTFLGMSDWGSDTYYEKTRVIAVGQMSDGVTPIVYTAISAGEGAIKREVPIVDVSANTEAQVKAIAEARLAQLTNIPPQARVESHGLETTSPGDNMWYSVRRNKVHGQYKVLELTDKFGMKVPGWRCETVIEKEIKGTSEVLEDTTRKQQQITKAVNPNKLGFSFNFEFDDSSQIASATNMTVVDGSLILTAATGNMVSVLKTSPITAGRAELRYVGSDLGATTIQLSCDDGNSYTNLTRNSVVTVPAGNRGKKLRVKIIGTANTNNPYPKIDSLGILFDI